MPCYHPVPAFLLDSGEVVFAERGRVLRSLFLPCGQCIGCRLEKSRQAAVRCTHEAKMSDRNCFITLTYAPEHLPSDLSLHYKHFQDFAKRLRKRGRFRFYMCGEYGEGMGRPHFHACLFGIDFPDRLYFKKTAAGTLYTSKVLEKLWPFGFSTVADFSFELAAYTARYCVTKVTGRNADRHYRLLDKETGELIGHRKPEFNRMSLRPGLGAPWLQKYWTDAFPGGQIVINGKKCKTPRYYDKIFARVDPDGFARLQLERMKKQQPGENTDDRLLVQEAVSEARMKSLKRSLT